MNFKKLTFQNPQGEQLSARLDLPVDGQPIAYALFAHCFTCSKNLKAVANINEALNQQGIAVLRFDFTGLGESEGDFADTNFSSNIEDLVAAARFLKEAYEAPKIMIGHSLGGAAILQAALQVEEVVAVATIGAPHDPEHVEHLFESSREEIERDGQAVVRLAGRPFTIKKQFIEDLRGQQVDGGLARLKRALLIMHSPVDRTVSIDNAKMIFLAARHPKSFLSLDQADHLLTNELDSRYVGTVLAAWARKYIGALEESPRFTEDAHDSLVVARIGEEPYRTEILANGHAMLADEPRSLGGTNAGPTPYQYLAAGLGACTAITLRMYADRKKWPLQGVSVELTHQKVHAEDCDCEARISGKIDQIQRVVSLEGPLDEDQQARLLEIANRCPVHRTLMEGQVDVKTRMGET